MKYALLIVLLTCNLTVAQQTDKGSCLFHVGLANTLLGGMYDGFYSVDQLKLKGNFGIGAPHQLDGELLILNGRVWQTTHTDTTFEADGSVLIPYAAVHDFNPILVLTEAPMLVQFSADSSNHVPFQLVKQKTISETTIDITH